MEWLRTNGVCFPVAGMVKRALIECIEKGLSLNNGRIVHFCQRPSRYTVRFAHIVEMRALQHLCVSPPCTDWLPVWLSISAISVQHAAPVGLACSGMPAQRARVARESVLPALAVIREIVCVLDAALCELRWTPHCNKSNVTAGTGWNATTTPDPPPSHKSWTVHQGSLYNSTHSFLAPLTRWNCPRWIVKSLEASFSIFLVSPVGVLVSPLLTKPFSFTPVHFSNWHQTLRVYR